MRLSLLGCDLCLGLLIVVCYGLIALFGCLRGVVLVLACGLRFAFVVCVTWLEWFAFGGLDFGVCFKLLVWLLAFDLLGLVVWIYCLASAFVVNSVVYN